MSRSIRKAMEEFNVLKEMVRKVRKLKADKTIVFTPNKKAGQDNDV